MVIGYLASRFPDVSQTWMLRELEAVGSDPEIECELLPLFPPQSRMGTVHPSAEGWIERLRRPGPREAVASLAWWLRHSPRRLLAAIALVCAGYVRRPNLLARALVTVAIASAHARSVARLGVDHLHAHTATYPVLAAWLCHRLTGVTYSFTPHGQDLYVDQSFLETRLAAARFVIAISDFNRGFLAAYGGDRATPVHLVRCGIDLSTYRFRPRAPVSGDPVRALCVASLKDPKGQHVLFEALAHGGPELDRVSIDLVGDGPLRERLQRLAEGLGLADRVSFHGALPEPAVAEFLGDADLFVLPSMISPNGTMEGLPMALMEALAAGVPVVATRVSAVPELIRDGETGLLAEPGDAADLSRAIRLVLADPESARRRSETGRALVERNHDAVRSGIALAHLFKTGSPYVPELAPEAHGESGPLSEPEAVPPW